MPWLSYTDDEVSCFHPEFKLIADSILCGLGVDSRFHWEHHPRTSGIQVVPDFVLVETSTNRWWLIVEVKRSRSSVYSERSQIQAKGYAEANQSLYVTSRARYFCLTNLEATLLFALNGSNPARECGVKGMAFDSGSFSSTPAVLHKTRFSADLKTLIEFVLNTPGPIFDVVWPRIARTLVTHAASLIYDPKIDLGAGTLPSVVVDYFSGGTDEAPKRELLLRCLIAEYLKGVLTKHNHKRSASLPALRPDLSDAANVIDALRAIDFSGIFESSASALYRQLISDPRFRKSLEDYIQSLIAERVDLLAMRNDALELPEVLIAEAYPLVVKNARGKAQTDPDLAALLSTLAIERVDAVILDPGCGDGNLLSAAYDALTSQGASHAQALARLKGLDADTVATKVAALRLALKEPYAINSSDPNWITPGDMFSSAHVFSSVDVVLMNPPFKRYEAHDATAIPANLRQHFRTAITALSGAVECDVGQANIYNLYVEFVVKASRATTLFGIILDNRWYHNQAAAKLRELLLRECEILAVVSYPHDLFFEDWIIATTMFIARKGAASANHKVHFIRTNDPRRGDFKSVAAALRSGSSYPLGWQVNKVEQGALNDESWQQYFSRALIEDFRISLPKLHDLFSITRSGRPDREGGGTEIYALPFHRTQYGPRRKAKGGRRNRYQTIKNGELTATENAQLRSAADKIPDHLRGYALVNSDNLSGYQITVSDVSIDQTFETPIQRTPAVQASYFSGSRRKWDSTLETAVNEIKTDQYGGTYISLIERLVGLNETVLSRPELWHVLQEPYAGELIIPRKLRAGHRVHINPFAYNPLGRQIRISSNFFHYYDCTAIDATSGLTRQMAVELIFAFLMSSFGQLQFEMEAYNREGARSIEQHQLNNISVLDPRWIRPLNRARILAAVRLLPYPVPTDRDPRTQSQLQALDRLIAEELHYRTPTLDMTAMLDEVWQTLAEWLEARRP